MGVSPEFLAWAAVILAGLALAGLVAMIVISWRDARREALKEREAILKRGATKSPYDPEDHFFWL